MTYANIDTDNGHDGFLLPNPLLRGTAERMDVQGRSLMNRLDLDTVLSWVPEGAGCLISAVAMGPFWRG